MKAITAEMLRNVLQAAADHFHLLRLQDAAVETKKDGSPVTAVDRGIDGFLRHRLAGLGSPAAWLSEESADDPARLVAKRVWVVDPLDGTKEFAQGIPEYAISVGLVEQGVPRAGAVMNPATGEGAATGTDGSWMEWGSGAAEAAVATLRDAAASVSRTELRDGMLSGASDLVSELRPIGSVAYKLLRVARGLDHLTFSVVPKSEWDICGGVALVAARRLRAERLDNCDLEFNQPLPLIECGFVAGPPALASAMAAALRRRMAATEIS